MQISLCLRKPKKQLPGITYLLGKKGFWAHSLSKMSNIVYLSQESIFLKVENDDIIVIETSNYQLNSLIPKCHFL